MRKIIPILTMAWTLTGCALIIDGKPDSDGQTKVENPGVPLIAPKCGTVLRDLLKKKYSAETDPKVKIDTDLDGNGIDFSDLDLSSEQRACLEQLKPGDFVSSVETSLKHHEVVGSCPPEQLIVASVETSLKYSEACRMSEATDWKRDVKVAASVETYLKFGEATREADPHRHRVFSGIETFLKFAEASVWFEYQETYRNVPAEQKPTIEEFKVQFKPGQRLYSNLDGSFSSTETYLKLNEALKSFGADPTQMRNGITKYHITDPQTLAKFNEFVSPVPGLELRSDNELLAPLSNLGFYPDCNSSGDFSERMGSKGIILTKTEFWNSTSADPLQALGFQYTPAPCMLAAQAARFTRDVYLEDFDQLMDKGVVSMNGFPLPQISDIGYQGIRAMDKGVVIRESVTEEDLSYLQQYFFMRKEIAQQTCQEGSMNYETLECSSYEFRNLTLLEQSDRFFDKGVVAPSMKDAAMMVSIMGGTPTDHNVEVAYGQPTFPEIIDRILDKGVAGTSASPILASMFIEPNGVEPQWADRVLDRGVYFDGSRFRSIESHLRSFPMARLLFLPSKSSK